MRLTLLFLLSLTACGDFPQLADTLSEAARNAPIAQLTPVPPDPAVLSSDDATFAQRVAALEARAELLRRSDIAALQ